MLNEKLTFNDLPEVVGKLCERIESLENALKDNLAKQTPAKENPVSYTHLTLTDKTGMNQSGQPFLVNVILVVASRLLLSTTFI